MEHPLHNPNLPAGQVRFCISSVSPQAEKRLRGAGVETLAPLPAPRLPAEERPHADMLFCHVGADIIFLAPSQAALLPVLKNHGFSPAVAGEPGEAYPANILLNMAICNDFAVGSLGHCDPLLLSALENSGRTLISVKQGYAKCAVCFVTPTAAITEDAGICRALRVRGADVLQIRAGDVYLSEKHYGFFGGAAGKLAPDILAVNGSLNTHRDGALIAGFLKKYGVSPLELHSGQITDVGGILPLTEEGA